MSLLLALPVVQTALAKHFTKQINEDTGVHLQINKLQITLTGAIILKDFIAYDDHQDTIFYGKRLQTYIRNPWRISKDNRLKFGKTSIDALTGKIIYYKGQKKSNLDIFIDKIDGEPSKNSNSEPFTIMIQKLNLVNSKFQYLDYNKPSPVILDFKHIQANIDDFFQKADLVSLNVRHLQLIDHRGLQIQNMKTSFKYDDRSIDIKNLSIKTPHSSLQADLVFQSPDNGYADFNNRIKITGKIAPSVIGTNDINLFSKIFAPDKSIKIQTLISGHLNRIRLKKLIARSSNQIQINGHLFLNNAFNDKNFAVGGQTSHLIFTLGRIQQLIPGVLDHTLIETLQPLGEIDMKGQLTYATKSLLTDVDVNTALGKMFIKLKMNHLNNISQTTYEGHIQTKHFKIKKFAKENIDDLSTNFKVKGKGLTLASLNANFVGHVDNILYNNYLYHNININGDFQKKLFQGQFDIADANLEMDFDGLIDFSGKKRKLDFYSEICKANLYNLNFSTDEFARLSGEVNLKAEGTSIDDVIGNAHFQNLKIVNQYDTYLFDDFSINSEFNTKNERNISFNSTDIVQGYIRGKFKFETIPVLVKNAFGSVFANYEITPVANTQYINYKFRIYNKIIELINPDFKVAKNTLIKGKINSIDNKLKLKLLSPKISYTQKDFVNVNLQIDNKNPLYNIFLKIDSINTGFYRFKNLRLLNTTINDTLYLKTKFEGGQKFDDKYDIAFYYTMDQWQNFIFGLQKSTLQFKNVPWLIDPHQNSNQITYNPKKDSLKINDVSLFHLRERISVSGLKNKDSLDYKINLDSINLAHITPEIKDFDFEGKINGFVHIAKYHKEILPSTKLNIKNFKMNGETLGDLQLKMSALPGGNIFVDLVILKQDLQTLKLIGYIDLSKKKPIINTTLLLNDFPVKTLQNLFKDTFTKIRGKISGSVTMTGPIDNVSFDGKLYLKAFGLNILALNVDYQFKDKTTVYLHHQTFELKNAVFYDTKYKTTGDISGVIKHHNFDNWYLDLDIKTGNLLVLDTPPDPLEMFYGTVFTAGSARIHGYVNHLKIDASMQTKKNTDFVITLTDVETMGEDDFIRIISKQAYKKEKKSKKKHRKIYEGLEMNFDLDITPDAQVEILLDQEFGSTLVAKGSGLVLMEVNTNGQFNIFGDFAVQEGVYNFKYGGVIDKKFVVEPGSYISWEGDPYNATLDIKAVYETFADPTVILADQGLNAKKMPVDVIIYLKNNLMKPDISFDLELPKANAILKSQLDYTLSDPDKKTLQVLSLLSFGNFINENDYNLSRQAGETAVKTISETGLNILNSIMAQDDKFQVNLNYTRGDENINRNIVTDPQVGLSLVTQINKKVYINGKVAIPVGRYTKSSIVGDVELEVYLDEKGNLIFRVFNKQTELEYIGQQEGYTQGIGISYQIDFDTFKDILQKFGISVKSE